MIGNISIYCISGGFFLYFYILTVYIINLNMNHKYIYNIVKWVSSFVCCYSRHFIGYGVLKNYLSSIGVEYVK